MKSKKKRNVYTRQQIARLQARALKLWKADNSHAYELGLALLHVRKAMKRGDFKPWWQSKGLVQSRVSYCMDLAKGALKKRRSKPIPDWRRQAAEATQSVNKKLNKLFRTCASIDKLATSSIRIQLRDALGTTVAKTAALAGWKLDTPEVKKAGDDLNNAIAALIEILSRPPVKSAPAEEHAKAAAASRSV